MWVLKTKGESYYVNHVDCTVPWSTKETPDNPSTKGSLRVKNCLMVIDEDNNATLSPLTPEDRDRLNGKKEPVRLITSKGYQLKQALENHNIKHSAIKHFGGGCGTSWFVVNILNEKDFLFLSLTVNDIRKLMPNEYYYTAYDDKEDDEGEVVEREEELYDN
jgi:hypothetical protein